MNKSLHLTFFGSGPVAASSLEYLAEQFTIDLVVTKNRPTHHKDPAPVEVFASTNKLPLAFADDKVELNYVINEKTPPASLGIVIDYGVIISQTVIDYFDLGILNSHFSILPEWRGADPITFSILSGQTITGVSLMRINTGLDTGDIIGEAPIEIEAIDTNQSLTRKLIDTSNALLGELLPMYIDGSVQPIPQSPEKIATYSRKLDKQDSILDVNKPAAILEREIRAFSEWPKSKIKLGSVDVIVTTAASVDSTLKPGEISTDNNTLVVGTRVGALNILELMPLGKKPMPAKAFLNGYKNRLSNT